jgi:hypothetical protein
MGSEAGARLNSDVERCRATKFDTFDQISGEDGERQSCTSRKIYLSQVTAVGGTAAFPAKVFATLDSGSGE